MECFEEFMKNEPINNKIDNITAAQEERMNELENVLTSKLSQLDLVMRNNESPSSTIIEKIAKLDNTVERIQEELKKNNNT